MQKLFYILIGSLFISCGTTNLKNQTTELPVFHSNNTVVLTTVNGKRNYWGIDPSVATDLFQVEASAEVTTVKFISKIDTISFDILEKDTVYFNIQVKGHAQMAYTGIVGLPKVKRNHDPDQAKIHTEDIYNFWRAYKMAKDTTLSPTAIYQSEYFDKASKGMSDYMNAKVRGGVKQLVEHIEKYPKYYEAIEGNTLKVEAFKSEINHSFEALKKLYPQAVFPDLYFVVGAFTSGGTVSNAGLLMGINQIAKTAETPVDEFSFELRSIMSELDDIPTIVAHELIHFQQDDMSRDTITLGYVIQEGMADFIGELIAGEAPNKELYNWAEGKEQEIWKAFKKDMYFNRYGNWIANSASSTKDNPGDQGYWIGYQICKAYYDKMEDKNQAIYDMLHIRDFSDFLSKSGWEKDLNE